MSFIMQRIKGKVKLGRILVSDGAWGTFLQQKGLAPGECPEQWNIDHYNEVFEVAKSYIDAGSDMIETNSFGGSRLKLAQYGLEDRVVEINKIAAEISRSAAGKEKHVLGSIGPTGKIIMMGDVTPEELYEVFKEQSMALEEGGADSIVVETMSDIEEARQAVIAASENTGCEIICTMTFERTVSGEYRSMMGISPTQMTEQIIDAGAEIIGANCGNGIEGMIYIVREIRKVNSEIPVLIHANAGLPIYKDGKTIFPETPEQMAGFVKELIDSGANIIGGCCGTTPAHISKIVEVVRSI
jgi:5-methyltetrahydrofolate--homocysteine methyltransferase